MAKLTEAPVYFTIAQVRHNALLALDRYIPDVQESMRKAGYPDYRQTKLPTFVFSASAGESAAPAPSMELRARYMFANMERTKAFVLFSDSISLETSRYGTWREFRQDLLAGVRRVSDIVGGLAFADRLGLRYLDAVMPESGESVGDYINREFHGLPARMPDTALQHAFSEAKLTKPDVGTVLARVLIQRSRLALPPDITLDLGIDARFSEYEGEHAVLDTDGFWEAREAFDISTIEKRFEAIHGLMGTVFESIVSAHALQRWA